MNALDASQLAKRLAAAFPGVVTVASIALRAEKMADWELSAAERAVESLIDFGRGYPTVAEMREAYTAAGGNLPDPSRNMSPPRHRRPDAPAEPTEIRALLRGVFDTVQNAE